VSPRTKYRISTYGPAAFLLPTAAAQAWIGAWVAAFAIATAILCMVLAATNLRSHFHLGYSRAVVDNILDSYRHPDDRRPVGARPEPWDVMYGPEPELPAALRPPQE
jgi:hypothetical protein